MTQVPSSCKELYDLCAIHVFTLTKDMYESAHVLFLRARFYFFINGWSVKWVQTNRTTGHSHLYCYISRQCFLISMHVIIGRLCLCRNPSPFISYIELHERAESSIEKNVGWVCFPPTLPLPPYPCCFLKCATSSTTILIINNFFQVENREHRLLPIKFWKMTFHVLRDNEGGKAFIWNHTDFH